MVLAQAPDKAASPFPVGVGLDGVVAHHGWREARGRVLDLLAGGGGGIIALIGPAGTGKTLLLRELARTLRADGRRVTAVDRPDLDAPAFAAGTRDAGRADVVLVDEAGRMDDGALERLARSGAACVLAGLPGFAHRLKRLGIAADAVDLPPMDVDEVARFVATRLAAAGRKLDLLSPGAVLELAAQSGGIPRLVNMLAGTAVFLASLEGAREVDSRHVLDAASLRAGEQVSAQTPAGAAPAAEDGTGPAQARVHLPPLARAPAEPARDDDGTTPPAQRGEAGRSGPRIASPPAAVRPVAGQGPAPGEAGAGHTPDPGAASLPGRPRPSILSLSVRHPSPAWVAAAFCLVAAGLWLLPGPARRDPASWFSAIPHKDAGGTDKAATPPAPSAEVVPSPSPAPPDPSPAAPAVPTPPQTPSRARGEDAAARALPAPPRPRPEPPPPPEGADAPAVAAPPRVVVHAQPGPAMAEAGRMGAGLEREFGAVELRAVPSAPKTPTVRYFYAEDAPTARRVAGALAGAGEGWRVQYLGTFRPLPRRGTIEVWVP